MGAVEKEAKLKVR